MCETLGGYGLSGTWNHGSGTTLDGKPETTDTVLFGPGDGIIFTGGRSDTTVWYGPDE